MDKISAARRSENMRRIKSKDTAPELTVRKLVRQLGYAGYRLHRQDLPGKPDLAWLGRKYVIFVHGCFWHGHKCKAGVRKPKSNQGYWLPKIIRNRARDAAHVRSLRRSGWKVLIVWECSIKHEAEACGRIARFLRPTAKNAALPRRHRCRVLECWD